MVPGRGGRQRALLRTALARLVPSDGLGLADLLAAELPRLPRALVPVLLTPVLDAALGTVLGALQREGLEAVVVWIGRSAATPGLPETWPERVPVYPVRDEEEVRDLGGRRL